MVLKSNQSGICYEIKALGIDRESQQVKEIYAENEKGSLTIYLTYDHLKKRFERDYSCDAELKSFLLN